MRCTKKFCEYVERFGRKYPGVITARWLSGFGSVSGVDVGPDLVSRDASQPLYFEHALNRNEFPFANRLVRNLQRFSELGYASGCLDCSLWSGLGRGFYGSHGREMYNR